jgi:hypothetical protein
MYVSEWSSVLFDDQVSSVEVMGEWGCMNGRPRQMVEQRTEQTTGWIGGI